MSNKLTTKILFGVCFALIFGLAAGVLSAQADISFEQPAAKDCRSCHYKVAEVYDAMPHGESGIDCGICHSPVSSEHPKEVMPTDISSRLCANCHLTVDKEFETSVHGQEDLTCVRCHNAHTADIRTENVQALCENCHEDFVHSFASTTHSRANIFCTDCHQQTDDNGDRVGPGDITHTFVPNLETCSACHLDQMHNPHQDACETEDSEDVPCEPQEVVESGFTLQKSATLMAEPEPASISGFILIGILVGLAAGMILAPWLEKIIRLPRFSVQDSDGEQHE